MFVLHDPSVNQWLKADQRADCFSWNWVLLCVFPARGTPTAKIRTTALKKLSGCRSWLCLRDARRRLQSQTDADSTQGADAKPSDDQGKVLSREQSLYEGYFHGVYEINKTDIHNVKQHVIYFNISSGVVPPKPGKRAVATEQPGVDWVDAGTLMQVCLVWVWQCMQDIWRHAQKCLSDFEWL